MMLHPRHKIRVKAHVKFKEALINIIQEFDLTYGEIFYLLSKEMLNWAEYMKKDEDEEGVNK